MGPDEARSALERAVGAEAPALMSPGVLAQLTQADVPEEARFEVGRRHNDVVELDWNGSFWVQDGTVFGEADHSWSRKYWYSALGLEQYLDIVQRAAERRQRAPGDVVLVDADDDGNHVELRYVVVSTETTLARAYDEIRRIDREITEAADRAVDEVGIKVAEVSARLSGWGENSLDSLIDAVSTAPQPNEKGRALEELCARLFASVAGFTVQQRVLTETEEIDIVVLNASADPRFVREKALILVECKNWMGCCGEDEFALFHAKMRNRNRRCTLGFLVSWNGFSETVSKEMLRGSREKTLVIPVTGADIRAAVVENDFSGMIARLWDEATTN